MWIFFSDSQKRCDKHNEFLVKSKVVFFCLYFFRSKFRNRRGKKIKSQKENQYNSQWWRFIDLCTLIAVIQCLNEDNFVDRFVGQDFSVDNFFHSAAPITKTQDVWCLFGFCVWTLSFSRSMYSLRANKNQWILYFLVASFYEKT